MTTTAETNEAEAAAAAAAAAVVAARAPSPQTNERRMINGTGGNDFYHEAREARSLFFSWFSK